MLGLNIVDYFAFHFQLLYFQFDISKNVSSNIFIHSDKVSGSLV